MNDVKAYLFCVRLGTAMLLGLVSLVCYSVANQFTHHAWLGICGIFAFGLAIRPLYAWLLDLPERYE
jgi:hypothetical protein